MSHKRKRSSPEPAACDDIFQSTAIEDRSSTFIGYFSPSLNPKDLQKSEQFASASHKIVGWRRTSNQQAITGSKKYVTGHDDDGEKFAGKRVENVLQSMQVSGACVVARWYGGVLLGPVRFTHIEECAKQAVQAWQELQAEEMRKKHKATEESQECARLLKVLAERDSSITILRTLAVEKEEKIKLAKVSGQEDAVESTKSADAHQNEAVQAKPVIDYSAMPVDRLKMLEKARDATLSFLLKRIDKADAELSKLGSDKSETI